MENIFDDLCDNKPIKIITSYALDTLLMTLRMTRKIRYTEHVDECLAVSLSKSDKCPVAHFSSEFSLFAKEGKIATSEEDI